MATAYIHRLHEKPRLPSSAYSLQIVNLAGAYDTHHTQHPFLACTHKDHILHSGTYKLLLDAFYYIDTGV